MNNHSHNNSEDTYSEDYSGKQNFKILPNSKNKSNMTSKKTRKKMFFIMIPVILIISAIVFFISLPSFMAQDEIAPNVWVGNVSIGNMSLSEAEKVLTNSYNKKNTYFSVIFNNNGTAKKKLFTSKDIDFTIDTKKTLEEALKIGRSEKKIQNSIDYLSLLTSTKKAKPYYQCNNEKLSKVLYEFGVSIHGTPKDIEYSIENNTLVVTPPVAGQSDDISLATTEFLTAMNAGIYTDIPITLISNTPKNVTAEEIHSKIYIEPKNAEYKVNNNQVEITDHALGRDIDKTQLEKMVNILNSGSPVSVELMQTQPQYTKEQLQQSLFNTTLSTFYTEYKKSSENRAYNIELAAGKLNGFIIADGTTFSYNKVVGNANAENGFKMATVFSNGKVTEGVGGGVCQVSTTLYGSVVRTGLEVVERYNHSLPVSYVPKGQDATVAYDYLDFKFKNNTGAPIMIVTNCNNRTISISIVGSEHAKKNVEIVSEFVSETPYTTIEEKDATLAVGERKTLSEGSPGSIYMTYRRIYNPDGTLHSEKQIKSTYRATPAKIAVGTAQN